jgi:hypothetical protein
MTRMAASTGKRSRDARVVAGDGAAPADRHAGRNVFTAP